MNRRHFASLGKGLRVVAAVGPTVLMICMTILGMGMVYSIWATPEKNGEGQQISGFKAWTVSGLRDQR